MIIKSYKINELDIHKNKIFLLYGKNEGLKQDSIKILSQQENNKTIYEEKEILDNPNIFLEGVLNQSLFVNQKTYIIKRATDKILEIIKEINTKQITNLIIVDAEKLDKKSKLRSFFEKEKRLICVPFYPDDDRTLNQLAFEFFKKNKISISQSNINQIVSKSQGDRANLLNELKKIKYYSNNGKKITDEIFEKLITLSENYSVSEIIDNFLLQNRVKLMRVLNDNIYTSEDYLAILRMLLNKSKKLLNLSLEYEKNKNIELTILNAKPPIFWKEKETTKYQIQKWKPNKIKLLIYRVNELELMVKKNLNNALNLITNFLLEQSSIEANN